MSITIKTSWNETSEIAVGDFLSESLVTDTIVWEVVKITAKTVTVRSTARGETIKSDHVDGNPYPVNYTEAVSDPNGDTKTLRLRKDNSIRIGNHVGAHPLYPTRLIDGAPVSRTDYRY